ncbi:MAG: CPBP family intramembrane metalloprotease [Bacteroidia bacterium]|nr:CPBP family intramembrane metalloprotease [Bacteroidia bacterium]
MHRIKSILLLLFIVGVTVLLPFISSMADEIIVFNNLSKGINKQIAYQPITLFITIFFLIILWTVRKEEFLDHFRKGNISAPILPEPWAGIKPKSNENWWHFGRNFAIIISLVTIIVIYFQFFKNGAFSFVTILKALPFILVFSLTNSFVEEVITRLGVVVILKNTVKDKTIPIISAIIFGTVHYWGNPGGIVGILVAGFLGWFLAKSILETKGIFWAWLI